MRGAVAKRLRRQARYNPHTPRNWGLANATPEDFTISPEFKWYNPWTWIKRLLYSMGVEGMGKTMRQHSGGFLIVVDRPYRMYKTMKRRYKDGR